MRRTIIFFVTLLSACSNLTSVHSKTDVDVHTFRHEFADTHLLIDGDLRILIDPGYAASAAKMIALIRAQGIRKLDLILLTHAHYDHAAAAPIIQAAFGGPIIAGVGERTRLARGVHDRLCPTSVIAKLRHETDQAGTFEPFDADRYITVRSTLTSILNKNVPGTIEPLPSHTRGSIGLMYKQVAFVGDLFRGSVVGSSTETHYYTCDPARSQRIAQAMLKQYPNVETFFMGHFSPVERSQVSAYLASRTQIPNEAQFNFFGKSQSVQP